MSTQSLGKKFEQKFKEDFLKISGSTIDRLYDVTMGYKKISQVSDFIGYCFPYIFYLECKTIRGKSFPFSNLTQYEKLLEKDGIKGVITGVIIWYYEQDIVGFIPISAICQLKKEGKKSLNVQLIIEEKYNIINIPSKKLRTFMDSDYSVLIKNKIVG